MNRPRLPNPKLAAAIAVVILAGVLFTIARGNEFRKCVLAEYDLRRDTNFRLLTGACTAVGKDGGQVYVDQLRAFGSGDHNDDGDHSN